MLGLKLNHISKWGPSWYLETGSVVINIAVNLQNHALCRLSKRRWIIVKWLTLAFPIFREDSLISWNPWISMLQINWLIFIHGRLNWLSYWKIPLKNPYVKADDIAMINWNSPTKAFRHKQNIVHVWQLHAKLICGHMATKCYLCVIV